MISGKMTVEMGGQEYTLQQAPNSWKALTEQCGKRFTGRSRPGEVRTKIH
jgi:hypothetical protein